MTAINTKNFENEDLSQWSITAPDKKLGVSQCLSCARYRGDRPVAGPCCQAYPGGIPTQIFTNEVKHDKHLPDDGGLYYVEDDDDLSVELALAYDESEHPRDEEGQWTEKTNAGGVATAKFQPPKHDKSIKFEPSYRDPNLKLDNDLVAHILGIQPDSRVSYYSTQEFTEDDEGNESYYETGNVVVEIRNKKYHAYREIDFDNSVIINQSITVAKPYAGQGFGTKILYDQVKGAKEAGFDRIETDAVRMKEYNGYYTWPRLGYDQLIDRLSIQNGWKAHWKMYGTKLSDVMATQEGRDDWKAHGDGGYLIFDLHDKKALTVLTAARRAKDHDALALAFDESKHPRDDEGQWAEKSNEGGVATLEQYAAPKAHSSIQWVSLPTNSGGDIDRDLVASILGIQPNSRVDFRWMKGIKPEERNAIFIEIRNDKYVANRFIYFGEYAHIENVFFSIEEKYQGQGLGTKILYEQVQGAKAAGFKYIRTDAVRDDDMNGYYTWPRLGFDTKMRPSDFDAGGLKHWLKYGENISDVMKTQAGRDDWKAKGEGVIVRFDLNNKNSLAVLTAARRAKDHDALALAFDESLHPRDPAGSDEGGEFTSKGSGGGTKTKTKTKTKAKTKSKSTKTGIETPPIQYQTFSDEGGNEQRDSVGYASEEYNNFLNQWYENLPEVTQDLIGNWQHDSDHVQEQELANEDHGIAWNAALDSAPKFMGPEVYRGLFNNKKEFTGEFEKLLTVGNTITFTTTQSSSKSAALAERFARNDVLLRILGPINAVDMSNLYDDYEDEDAVDPEYEVLLRKGSKYQVVSVERNAKPFNTKIRAFVTLRQIS